MNILAVGYNAFDITVQAEGFPERDSKVEVPPILTGGGGPAATAAVAMARLGARVRLVTPLADDGPGRWQEAELLAAGVDLSRCPRPTGSCSPLAVILVDPDDGQRTIFWSRGGMPPMDPGLADASLLEGVDLLYTDGHDLPLATVLAAMAQARGLPVVMDAGSVREGSRELVGLCTDVIGSRGFASALAGTVDVPASLGFLRGLGPQRVGMTWGEQGVLGLSEGGFIGQPAFAVPVKDTTGAGDVFHAGYAIALAEGRDFGSCLEFGAAVAALKCQDWGGRRGLPDRPAVLGLLAEGRRHPLGVDLAVHLPKAPG